MPSQSDIRIVILGKTGTGKSETGNSILGGPEFECSPGGETSTQNCLKKIATRFGKNILVIDTPGLQDSKLPSDAIRSEIQKSIEMAYPIPRMANSGANVFLLCLKMGRITAEDETMFKECLVCFGEELYRFTIVVFTHLDIWEANMKYSRNTPDDGKYIQSLPPFAKEFIAKCCGKVFFNNRKTGSDMELQVKSLFQKIDEMMDLNDGKLYTEEILQQVLLREKQKQHEQVLLREKLKQHEQVLLREKLKQHEQVSSREKMPNYMNYINRTNIVTSVLALGNVVLLYGISRR